MQSQAKLDQGDLEHQSTHDNVTVNPSINRSIHRSLNPPINQLNPHLVRCTSNGSTKRQWTNTDDQSTTTVSLISVPTDGARCSRANRLKRLAGSTDQPTNPSINQPKVQLTQQPVSPSITQSTDSSNDVSTSVLSICSRSDSSLTVLSRVRMVDRDGRQLMSVARLLHVGEDGKVLRQTSTSIQSKL